MLDLEKKKLEFELLRVKASRFEMEIRIEERKAEIKRLQDGVDIQIAKEKEIEEKMKE